MGDAYISAIIGEEETVAIPRIIGKYEYVREIGSGAFSVVLLVLHKGTGVHYACKVCSRNLLQRNGIFDRFEREMRILQSIKHPNIVELVDVVYDEKLIYLVMEFCEKGELFQFIVDQKRLDESMAKQVFSQIVNAIKYLHDRDIAHRDIKPENILLDSDMNVKLADFGLCHNVNSSCLLKTPCGSPFYAPPEVIANKEYDGKLSDIWSIGVVLFTMITGSLPWKSGNQTQLFLQIENADYTIPRWIPHNIQTLIKGLMAPNPRDRIPTNDILNHPWFSEESSPIDQLKPIQERFDSSRMCAIPRPQQKKAIIVRPNATNSGGHSHSAHYNQSYIQPIQALIRKVPKQPYSGSRK